MWNKFGVPEIGNASDCYQKQIQKAVEEHDRLQAAIDGIPLDRLEAICNAEREGRLLTPPCKLGDTVYWVSNFGSGIRDAPITAIRISGFGLDLNLSRNPTESTWREAEKCYFTRESAETALKERGNNG